MKSLAAPALAALAWLAATTTDAGTIGGLLPLVGTLSELDVAGRKLTLKGPDGKDRSYQIPAELKPLAEYGKNPTLEELAQAIGKPVGIVPQTASSARMISLLNLPEEPPRQGFLREVHRDTMSLRFTSPEGETFSVSPAVNLGASSEEGEAPGNADWAWFEKRLNKSFSIKTVKVLGMTVLWSVSPWNPKQKEEPAAPRELKP